MPMYNLIENSSYYSKTTGNVWFYPYDKATTFNNNIENPDNFKSFKYKYKETQLFTTIQIKLMEF